nr:MAG TPA: hypothetical protein [Caudoviricetes sp.]
MPPYERFPFNPEKAPLPGIVLGEGAFFCC